MKQCNKCIHKEYNYDNKSICKESVIRNNTQAIFDYIYCSSVSYDCPYYQTGG
jgi:hypothetical protein